jgi:membrane associated rhomboid family serine protease
MPNLPAVVALLISVLVVGLSLVATRWSKRRDRREIVAQGRIAAAVVTQITPVRNGVCSVGFSFQPHDAGDSTASTQKTTRSAVDRMGLAVGSSLQVRYLAASPNRAFAEALILAERTELSGASIFFVSFSGRDQHRGAGRFGYRTAAPANSYRWYGNGDVVLTDQAIQFSAEQRRSFRFATTVQREFALSAIVNVEHLNAVVRLQILESGNQVRTVQFWTASPADADAIAQRLPSTRTEKFSAVLTERAAFEAALLQITPHAPVTPALVGINVLMFAIAVSLGGGLLVPNLEVMIRLGANYTPLTLAGQWWRLLTCTFLHFGFAHLAFNMWALYVNGLIAERIFGNIRYVFIYLVAGVSASVASLLWHPIVTGAGASGAIFGVLGALIAFFIRGSGGVPRSVTRPQLASVAVFVVYSLANGARIRGIDNAAHLGGLAAGFCMGLLLARPLEADRNSKPWTAQWATALTLCGGTALLVAHQISTGALAPRVARDESGNPIPLAGLTPARSLAGIRLGMTANEVLRARGAPIRQDQWGWVYNSIDSKHSGIVSITFTRPDPTGTDSIDAIEFYGDEASAPAELPYLGSLTAADVIQKYGQPVRRREDKLASNLWFRNGLIVVIMNDKVYRYGIFDPALLRQ